MIHRVFYARGTSEGPDTALSDRQLSGSDPIDLNVVMWRKAAINGPRML